MRFLGLRYHIHRRPEVCHLGVSKSAYPLDTTRVHDLSLLHLHHALQLVAGSKLWVHSSFPQAATSYTCHNETVQSLQVATAANPSSTAFPVAPLHRCTVAASRRNDNCWGHESFGRLSPVNLPSFCISSWAQLLPCLSIVQFLRSSRSTLSTTYKHDASTRRTRVAYIQVVGARPSCTALSQT